MKIEKKETVVFTTEYVADDGKRFSSIGECQDYEQDLALRKRIDEVPCCHKAEDFFPADGKEYDYSSHRYWYKPETYEHLDILCAAYKGIYLTSDHLGKWICIEETVCGAWSSLALENSMRYVERLFGLFGYKVTFEKEDEAE